MSRFVVYLGRLSTIFLGFFCASLAASAFLHLLMLGVLGWEGRSIGNGMLAMMVTLPVGALFASYFAFAPAVFVIVVAELLGWRSWLFYSLAGGAAAIMVAVSTRRVEETANELALIGQTDVFAGLVGAGFVAGIAYWYVAGRNAGQWLDDGPGDKPTAQSQSES